jgi:hypothetical protein
MEPGPPASQASTLVKSYLNNLYLIAIWNLYKILLVSNYRHTQNHFLPPLHMSQLSNRQPLSRKLERKGKVAAKHAKDSEHLAQST